ncbi:FHA domain-containing protein [Chloroflexales bacterium ZM16-3]|nr:FHA domain-containing protein [Chloroflexales bacterium ZM16-3]
MVHMPTTVLMPTTLANAPQVSVRNQYGPQGTVSLGPNGLSVGREATCDIVLDSQNVSRHHAQISWDGTQSYITDFGSTNGCRLAGQQLQSGAAHPWSARTPLQVGDCLLRLEIPGAAPAATTQFMPPPATPTTQVMSPPAPLAPTPLPIVQPMSANQMLIQVPAALAYDAALSNSSGLGAQSSFPKDAGGLNFGAFMLTPIWAIAHGCWGVFILSIIPYVGLVIPFVALFSGNEWAWRKRTWRDVDHLKRSQRGWAVASLVVMLLSIALGVLIGMSN